MTPLANLEDADPRPDINNKRELRLRLPPLGLSSFELAILQQLRDLIFRHSSLPSASESKNDMMDALTIFAQRPLS
jgi:hypothetical protein